MVMELEGKASPPMANGEIIFDAPWQSRVFGMARALCEQGLFDWDDFREHLIAEIETFDRSGQEDREYHYFEHFLNALMSLLDQRQMCDLSELNDRSRLLAERPHGHDH